MTKVSGALNLPLTLGFTTTAPPPPLPACQACRGLVLKFGLVANQYQLGHTKIFFRPGVLGLLEDKWARMQAAALAIQVKGGGWHADGGAPACGHAWGGPSMWPCIGGPLPCPPLTLLPLPPFPLPPSLPPSPPPCPTPPVHPVPPSARRGVACIPL